MENRVHSPRPQNISIIIPVYNESETVEFAFATLDTFFTEWDLTAQVIVIDNGSTDQTHSKLLALRDRYRWLNVDRLNERGPGEVFRKGVRLSSYEFIVTLDIDLSSELVFIPRALDLMNQADMVIGSKTFGTQRRTMIRVVLSQMFLALAKLLFDLPFSDYSMGAKAFRKSAIEPYLPYLDGWTGFVFDLALALHLNKKVVIEIPVNCDDKRSSKFNLLSEGLYRIRHLFNRRKLVTDTASWLYLSQ